MKKGGGLDPLNPLDLPLIVLQHIPSKGLKVCLPLQEKFGFYLI